MKKTSKMKGNGATSHTNRTLSNWFSHTAQVAAAASGHAYVFLFAVLIVIAWIATGPVFDYSDTWQLLINTGTTIVTFLMVFLIQNTQNRDMMAMQVKLSELVLSMKEAENRFASIEDLTDAELKELHDECRARADLLSSHLERRSGGESTDQKRRADAHRPKILQRKS